MYNQKHTGDEQLPAVNTVSVHCFPKQWLYYLAKNIQRNTIVWHSSQPFQQSCSSHPVSLINFFICLFGDHCQGIYFDGFSINHKTEMPPTQLLGYSSPFTLDVSDTLGSSALTAGGFIFLIPFSLVLSNFLDQDSAFSFYSMAQVSIPKSMGSHPSVAVASVHRGTLKMHFSECTLKMLQTGPEPICPELWIWLRLYQSDGLFS